MSNSLKPTPPTCPLPPLSSADEKAGSADSASSLILKVAEEAQGVDVVVALYAGHAEDDEPDPRDAKKLCSKLDWHILPLLYLLYILQAVDKNTLGASSILGIIQDNHLNTNQFNTLFSAFFIGYIIFVWPHAWLMQRFPIGKYIAVNVFFWAVFMGLHPLCHNFGGLFVLRFLLGASEGCITGGIMTITPMFYTRTEIGERLGWTFQCVGLAIIISGFIAFGVVHVDANAAPARWEWLMIIMAIISLITSVLFFFLFPDNPATAKFLSNEEKIMVVRRLKGNQNGIETKVWKKAQFVEAIKDIKTWYFFVFAAVSNLQGGINVQYSLIIKDFGFDTLQTTVLNIPAGLTMIIAITSGGILLKKFPNSRSFIGIAGFLPAILACFLLLFLPRHLKAGLLASMYIVQTSGLGFIMVLSWCTVTTAGHTKKMTTNAVFLMGFALGQALGSQFWKVQYRPRNTIPWIIQLLTYSFDIAMILVLRFHFDKENKRRDKLKLEGGKEYEEFGYVERINDEGVIEKVKMPIELLDVTDKENLAFRYVL